jgi:AAA domain
MTGYATADYATSLSTRAKLRKRFRLRSYDELAAAIPPDWILQAYIPEDALMMLYGPPNTFKSFIALDWALSVATGRSWLGACVPSRRKVVYVSAEGQRGIARRVSAWLRHHSVDARELTNISFVTCPVCITTPLEFKIFLENLEAMASIGTSGGTPSAALGLIILDTLARCFGGGDENSTQDMNAFVNACDELKRRFAQSVVLVIHHSGKDETLGARGSIAFHGATDVIFQTKARDGLKVTLANPRNKDMDELPARRLELVEVDPSLAVAASDEPVDGRSRAEAKVGSTAVANTRALELLQLLVNGGSGGGKISTEGDEGKLEGDEGKLVTTEGITYSAWFQRWPLPSGSTFNRYVKRLLNQGYVELRDNRYHLTPKGERSVNITPASSLPPHPLSLEAGMGGGAS